MKTEEKSCKYKGKVNLGDVEWDWCFYYNAKIDDVNCETCAQAVGKSVTIV